MEREAPTSHVYRLNTLDSNPTIEAEAARIHSTSRYEDEGVTIVSTRSEQRDHAQAIIKRNQRAEEVIVRERYEGYRA